MSQDQERITRPLGLGSLVALGINGIVGVGIFSVPSEVAAHAPGLAGLAAYALTALALLPVAVTCAVLGGRFDEDGGPVVWARAAFGNGVGFAVGWVSYASAVLSSSAVLSWLAHQTTAALAVGSPLAARSLAVTTAVVLTAVVALGLRPSAVFWSLVTVLKLIPLLLLVIFSFRAAPVPTVSAVSTAPVEDLARASLLIVFALQGFEIIPVPAASVREGPRIIPLATVLSLALATGLYIGLHAACVRAVPALATTRSPLVDAANVWGGATLSAVVAAGASISALGISFGMLAMTPRYLAALGRPEALGPWLSREDSRRVPRNALLVTLLALVPLLMMGELTELFVLSSIAVLVQYAMSAGSLTVLAVRRSHGLSPVAMWPAPLALGAIFMLAREAKLAELGKAALVLIIGVLVVAARRL